MSTTAFLALIRVQLLAGLNLNAFVVRAKRGKAWLATIGMAVALAPSYGMLIAVQVKSFAFVRSTGLPLEAMLLVGIYSATQLMILFASIPAVYSALYQSNELSILLPLPYRPWQIVTAKLAAIYLPELVLGWAFVVPALVLYCIYGYASLWFALAGVVVLVLLPAVPLALSTIACMLVALIPGIGRSKWFWYAGITVALLGVSLMFTAATSAADASAISDLVQVRMRQIGQVGHLLPGVQFALYALSSNDWTTSFHVLAYLAVVAGYGVAVVVLGSRYYIGPALAASMVTHRRRGRVESARARSFLMSVVRKEVLCTLKDPAVAMNGLGGYLALPLLAATYSVIKVQTRGKVDILGELGKALHSAALAQYLPYVVVGLALGLGVFGSLSSLFSASFSKDGKRLWVEKSLPVSVYSVFLGKLLAGLAMLTPLNVLTNGVFMLIVPLRAQHWLYIVLLSELILAWSGATGLAIDCLRPKLMWKDTVQAVKQNMNVVLALGANMAGAGLNVLALASLYHLSASPALVYGAVLVLNILLLGASLQAGRAASRRFHRVLI